MNKTLIIAAALFMAAALTSAQTKPSRTVWDGVYTEAQADRGKELVAGHCGYCHGEDLKGGPGAPQLVVAAIFRANGSPAHAEGERTPQRAALDDILIVKR